MHLLILWFRFTSQMPLLSNINFYFDCKTRLCPIVPGRQEKIYFCTRKFLSTRYCRTANFHVLVILTNLTNEKKSLKLQLVKVSSQILIKSGDTRSLLPVDNITTLVLLSYFI